MKNRQILYLIIMLFSMIFCSCSKNDENASSTNTEPYNEMTAAIDGTQWRSCKPSMLGLGMTNYASSHCYDSVFTLDGIDFSADNPSSIYLRIFNFNGIGLYYLGGNTKNIGGFDVPGYNGNAIIFITDSTHVGEINITKFNLGESHGYVSGTFQYLAYNIDSNKIVNITNGQFTNVVYSEN